MFEELKNEADKFQQNGQYQQAKELYTQLLKLIEKILDSEEINDDDEDHNINFIALKEKTRVNIETCEIKLNRRINMPNENSNFVASPPLTEWEPPIKVRNVITSLPSLKQSATFQMSHLLAAGFRGSEYQLLVLLEKLTELLKEKNNDKQFEAVLEAAGFGNLDDIGIVLKHNDNKVITVESYQVKYYNHPITVYDLYNENSEKNVSSKTLKSRSKDKKMHIYNAPHNLDHTRIKI